MAFVQNFPFFSIILSMFTGVLCAVLKPKAARNLCLSVLTIVGVLNMAVLMFVLRTGEYYVFWMGHFPAPFGNEIRIGILEALMAVVFSIVMILSLLGGMKHIFHDVEDTKVNLYFLMINLLFSSLLALIYTNDLFTAYVFVEINTIAACAIVMLKKSRETLVAAARYLMMSLLGSGLFLIGICTLYDITGHLLMSNIKESVAVLATSGQYHTALETVLVLFCIGLATKSALFPVHTWLPDAHGSSTSSSSAILSGLVVKGYIILLVKIFYRVIGLEIVYQMKATNLLFVMGLMAMLIGSIRAIGEKDLKRMVAYSSVAQIGYIYTGIGLGVEAGMAAAMFQIIAHAATKPMLFCAAGAFMDVSGGSKKFRDIKGAGRRNVLAGVAFAVGTLSMIGIPLTAGFVTKVSLALGAISASKTKLFLALTCLAISTVLNALYYVPTIMVVFSKTEDKLTWIPDKKDKMFVFAIVVFIAMNLVLGVCARPFLAMINSGLQMFG